MVTQVGGEVAWTPAAAAAPSNESPDPPLTATWEISASGSPAPRTCVALQRGLHPGDEVREAFRFRQCADPADSDSAGSAASANIVDGRLGECRTAARAHLLAGWQPRRPRSGLGLNRIKCQPLTKPIPASRLRQPVQPGRPPRKVEPTRQVAASVMTQVITIALPVSRVGDLRSLCRSAQPCALPWKAHDEADDHRTLLVEGVDVRTEDIRCTAFECDGQLVEEVETFVAARATSGFVTRCCRRVPRPSEP